MCCVYSVCVILYGAFLCQNNVNGKWKQKIVQSGNLTIKFVDLYLLK